MRQAARAVLYFCKTKIEKNWLYFIVLERLFLAHWARSALRQNTQNLKQLGTTFYAFTTIKYNMIKSGTVAIRPIVIQRLASRQ